MDSKALTLFLVIAGLLLAALITRSADIAWMALPFLAYLSLGILQSPSREKIHLMAERAVAQESTGGTTTIRVSVKVENQGAEIKRLCLSDPLQSGMKLVEGQLEQVKSLDAGETADLSYTFCAGRGSFSWKAVRVAAGDPFGLFNTVFEVAAAASAEVRPEVLKLRSIPLRPERTLHSAGSVPARRGGSGTDFWGVREYHPGDPLQRLDWRRMARHRGEIFTREFEQEEIVDVGLILDARQKTDLRSGEDSLFEHSVRAAASLAEAFLHQGNRVSLLIYGDPVVSLYPGYGKRQLNRILSTLAQVATRSDSTLDSLQFLPVRMFASHSIILILSPLASGDWLLFPRLRSYGYQVLLISPDPIDYARRMLPADPVTSMASRLAGIERRLEIGKITRLWIPVIDWQVGRPLAPLVYGGLSRFHGRCRAPREG